MNAYRFELEMFGSCYCIANMIVGLRERGRHVSKLRLSHGESCTIGSSHTSEKMFEDGRLNRGAASEAPLAGFWITCTGQRFRY